MNFDFPKLIGQLNDEERITFYEILAHNLTVCIRGVWCDESLNDGEKVEQIKYINEIMHRVVMKSAKLRVNRNTMSELDSWDDINHWVSCSPGIESTVESALKWSYNSCRS